MKRKQREEQKRREQKRRGELGKPEEVRMACTNCGPFEDWEDNVWIPTGCGNGTTTEEEFKRENEVFACPSCGNWQTRGGKKLGHPVEVREKLSGEAWGPWQRA
ncbi:hypothetical protein LCGC14_1912540 [marine sediment metagenome]|uniref:Uncharacterized protein n=1 Tax=marine sediment metagenome TaxID=412755 RepID=A0A0F9GGD0_9ZZZZ